MAAQNLRAALFVLPLLTIAGCGARLDEPQLGSYRAALELPGGEAPFGLEIAKEKNGYVLYLSIGSERTRVSDVTVANAELVAVFPNSKSSLRATMYRKRLEGGVTVVTTGSAAQTVPLRATLGTPYWFYEKSLTDNADVSGRWALTYGNDEGGGIPKAILVLEQEHDRVTGILTTPNGDEHAVHGQVHGDDVQLSRFAGGVADLYKLRVDDAGDLAGEYWQGLATHEKIAARRNADATLEDAGQVLGTSSQ